MVDNANETPWKLHNYTFAAPWNTCVKTTLTTLSQAKPNSFDYLDTVLKILCGKVNEYKLTAPEQSVNTFQQEPKNEC